MPHEGPQSLKTRDAASCRMTLRLHAEVGTQVSTPLTSQVVSGAPPATAFST
jgi:hypothetical protein